MCSVLKKSKIAKNYLFYMLNKINFILKYMNKGLKCILSKNIFNYKTMVHWQFLKYSSKEQGLKSICQEQYGLHKEGHNSI